MFTLAIILAANGTVIQAQNGLQLYDWPMVCHTQVSLYIHAVAVICQILGGPLLSLLQFSFLSFTIMDSPGGLDRAHLPTAKHFDAIYTVKTAS